MPARRYSEDLDYVRATAGGIGKVTRAISDIGTNLGFQVRTKMSTQPKVYLRYLADSGTTRKTKVEVNTHERAPATSTVRLPYQVTSNWWGGQANVHTFSPAADDLRTVSRPLTPVSRAAAASRPRR